MPIIIDAYVDAVCPYCYLGKRQLERALAQRPDLPVTLTWHPHQLTPDAPIEGRNYHERMAQIIGSVERKDAALARLADAGRALDLDLHFERITKMPNTFKTLCLINLAEPGAQQNAVVDAVYRSYFSEGRNLGDDEVLLSIANECGVVDAARRLYDADEINTVKNKIQRARQLGFGGVPAFIFNQQYLISGAQDASHFVQMLDQLADQK